MASFCTKYSQHFWAKLLWSAYWQEDISSQFCTTKWEVHFAGNREWQPFKGAGAGYGHFKPFLFLKNCPSEDHLPATSIIDIFHPCCRAALYHSGNKEGVDKSRFLYLAKQYRGNYWYPLHPTATEFTQSCTEKEQLVYDRLVQHISTYSNLSCSFWCYSSLVSKPLHVLGCQPSCSDLFLDTCSSLILWSMWRVEAWFWQSKKAQHVASWWLTCNMYDNSANRSEFRSVWP